MDLFFLFMRSVLGRSFIHDCERLHVTSSAGHDVSHDAHSDLGTSGHAEAGYNMPGFSPFSPTVISSFVRRSGFRNNFLEDWNHQEPLD